MEKLPQDGEDLTSSFKSGAELEEQRKKDWVESDENKELDSEEKERRVNVPSYIVEASIESYLSTQQEYESRSRSEQEKVLKKAVEEYLQSEEEREERINKGINWSIQKWTMHNLTRLLS